MRYFEKSARDLITRGLEIAQLCGASELKPEHLLAGASEEALARTGLQAFHNEVWRKLPPAVRPSTKVDFSQKLLELFERAYQSSGGQVEEIHLLLCQDLPSQPTSPRLLDLLTPDLTARLSAAGVDVPNLRREVDQWELAKIQPEKEFWTTPAGRRVIDLSSTCNHPDAGVFTMLLCQLVRPGPRRAALLRAGLSEPMLIAILAEVSGSPKENRALIEYHLNSADLECLGLDLPRFDEAARVAIVMAWNCAKRQQVKLQNLLDALLYADFLCQPGAGATAVLRHNGVLGFVHSNMKTVVALFDGSKCEAPQLSDEVRLALDHALSLTTDGLVSTQHLLYGLAMVGLDELSQAGLTAEMIRKHILS